MATNDNQDQSNEATDPATASCCSKWNVARGLIGVVLLTVMLANLVVYASPEWASRLGQWTGAGQKCESRCSSGGCCPALTSFGMPASNFAEPEGVQQLGDPMASSETE